MKKLDTVIAEFSVLTGRAGYGCSGWDNEDMDGYNNRDEATNFIFPKNLSADELGEIEKVWDQLWDGKYLIGVSPEGISALRDLGVDVPVFDAVQPKWGPDWSGSLAEYRLANGVWQESKELHEAELKAALGVGRVTLFEKYGGVATDIWTRTTRSLVHDFGCSCSHTDDTEGMGYAALQIVDGVGYITPPSCDIRAHLSIAQSKAEAAILEVETSNTIVMGKIYEKITNGSISASVTLEDSDDNITYAQWAAVRQNADERLKQAAAVKDDTTVYSLISNIGRLRIRSLDRVGPSSKESYLNGENIRTLNPEELCKLCELLKV